ncbi:FlgO family outer membrane protein [Pseudoalteromonas piscicida]|uniref:FlgO family outer membrane protein n=1 Tax=Pseudoalteromonas piscicida TaxID=43662 RepID=UPI002738BBE5|nr:FlgO family outer membrane protein [Pseudoalteromonas piscicida]MDP4488607.1 FlgO family outer membrane protein [Pseudoalteromonas piscicida]
MMKNVVLFATTLALLGGCEVTNQATPESTETQQSDMEILYAMMEEQERNEDSQAAVLQDIGFVSYRHRKEIANYANQIALELSDTVLGQKPESIAVASFVNFNESLRDTNQLGNQLAESLMHQMQKLGYQALDFKALGKIEVTSSGDLTFSRNASRLKNTQSPSHLLTGTMVYRPRGVEVNARLLEFNTNLVIASTVVTIPYFILDDQATAAR